jgi:hypothetical protein
MFFLFLELFLDEPAMVLWFQNSKNHDQSPPPPSHASRGSGVVAIGIKETQRHYRPNAGWEKNCSLIHLFSIFT